MPLIEGMLKRKTRFKGWRPRFYVLFKVGILKEYDSEATRAADKPHHVLDVTKCIIERGGGGETSRPYCFSILRINSTSLILQAQDKKQQRKWLKALRSFQAKQSSGINLESFRAASVAADDCGMVIGINKAATELLGYTTKDLVGQNVSTLATGVHQINHNQYIRAYLDSGNRKLIGRPRRVSARHINGSEVSVLLTLSEVYEDDERRFIATMTPDKDSKPGIDIEAFASAALAATTRGVIVAANMLAADFLGWPHGELIGKNVSVLMPPQLAARHDSYLERFERTGQSSLIGNPRKLIAKHRSGSPLPVVLVLGIMTENNQRLLLATLLPDTSGVTSSITSAAPSRYEEDEDWDESDTQTDESSGSRSSMSGSTRNIQNSYKDALAVASSSSISTSATLSHANAAALSAMLTSGTGTDTSDPTLAAISNARHRVLATMAATLSEELTSVSMAYRASMATRSTASSHSAVINLDDVTVLERITPDRGVAASVYECSIDGWLCAMKELDLKRCTDATLSSFEAEITFSERLPKHPNLVRYLGFDRSSERLRLFMTRYKCSLTDELARIKSSRADIAPPEIARLMLGLVNGLQCLHDQNIIHRDLKSDNIFVVFRTKHRMHSLVIGDFDVAKQGDATTIAGTPGYMAPEVFIRNPNQPYTAAADVWSLGMVLFELMTLERPNAKLSQLEMQQNLVAGVRAALPDALDHKYKALSSMYKSMTQKEPTKRLSLQEIAKQLSKIAEVAK